MLKDNSVTQVKESEDGVLKDQGTITISSDMLPNIPASDEEDTPANPDTNEKLERDSDSTLIINEQDHNETCEKGVYGNDEISEEDSTNNGGASRSSLIAQVVEGRELQEADKLVSEKNLETLEPEKIKTEEISEKEKEVCFV